MDLVSQYRLFAGILLFIVSNTAAWYQLNAYRFYEILEKNQLAFLAITAIPVTFGFFYAWHLTYGALNDWWSVRMLALGTTFLVFPILTHIYFHEPFFTPRILVSMTLALMIIFVQFLWR